MHISFDLTLTRKKKLLAGVLLVLLALLGGWYYYWTKTPTYSLKLIQESVQQHDIEKFKKHVDLDSLSSRLVDDIVGDAVTGEKNAFAAGILQLVKPAVVGIIKEKVIYYVENGDKQKSEPPADGKKTAEKASVQIDNTVDQKLKFSNLEYKKVAFTEKDGKTATVGIELFDKELQQSFTLQLKMRELADGTWQLMDIANFKDFLKEREKAKYAYYTAPPTAPAPLEVSDTQYNEGICTLAYPTVSNPARPEAAEKINSLIQDRINHAIEQGTKLAQSKQYGSAPYSVMLKYKIQVNDGKLLSIVFDHYTYSGGAHGIPSRQGMVFDAVTGNLMNWNDLYPNLNEARTKNLNQAVIDQSKAQGKVIFTPFKGLKEDKIPAFYVNENYKPVVIFQPYEIAPYSSGILEYELPDSVYKL